MYNYPNPLNVNIPTFHKKHSFVIKDEQIYQMDESQFFEAAKIERKDIKEKIINYTQYLTHAPDKIEQVKDIFAECKARKPKKRTAYMTAIAEAPAEYIPAKASTF